MAQLADNLQDNLSALGQVVFQTAATNLKLMLNQEVSSGAIEGQQFDVVTEIMGTEIEPFGQDQAKTVVVSSATGDIPFNGGFVLCTQDARYFANTMLGNDDGTDGELDELQVSAIGEIFSQFLTAAAPGMASMAGVNELTFGPPSIGPFSEDTFREHLPELLALPIVTLQCDLTIGDRVVPMQLWLSEEEAQQLSIAVASSDTNIDDTPADDPAVEDAGGGVVVGADAAAPSDAAQTPVTVQPVQFASFDNQPEVTGESNRNLDLLMDVKMSLSVRLGDTELALKQILELTRGSVVELNRLAGEAVDLYANGKLIARGEVVVIEDNFGLRITSIVSPQERLRELANV